MTTPLLANPAPSNTPRYIDGEIVREGVYGDQGDGAYSAGVSHATPVSPGHDTKANSSQRGGAGNIGSPHVRAEGTAPHDSEMIPELAIRNSTDEAYHTGVR